MKLPLPLPPARPMSRDKSDTLLLLFGCLLVLAPHAGHLPLGATLLCALLLAWRGWITLRGNRLPSHWLLLPLAAVTMAGVWLHHRTLFGRDAGVTMLVLLLAFKLLEMRARRDLFVVLFLSYFVLLTNFFYSQSIATALWMTAALVALLVAQISFQHTGAVPPLARRLRLAATVFGLALPLALVFFLFFPRIQGPLWGLPSDAQAGRSGLSNHMEPGAIARLALSDDIAFRARFDGMPPPPARRYWRGPVLGRYDGRVWTELRPPLATGQPAPFRSHGAPLRYQVTLEPHGQRWLFALETAAAAPTLSGNRARLGEQRELLANRPITRRLRYDTVSYLDFELEPIESPLLLRPWLQLPPGRNPQTLEFARQLRAQGGDAAQLAQRVLQYFRTEDFHYTLEPPLLGADGIDEFLFSTRAGFCEHYASAFVVLMRAMEVPARVVTGYQGGDINPIDGFMTVRQSDAHAWAEIWIDGRGWSRVDPTAAVAPSRIEVNLSGTLPRPLLGGLLQLDAGENSWLSRWQRLRAGWDAATNAWNQWVLNYGSDDQRALLRGLGFREPDWRQLALLMALSATALLALMLAPQLLRRRRGDAVDALYSALSRRLARHGLARRIHEGPRAWRQRLTAPQAPLPAASRDAAAQFLQLYEALRYGAPRGNPAAERAAALSRLKTLLNRCR